MDEHGIGLWIGLVVMVAGAVMALLFDRDALALGGSGLIVLGAMAAAMSFEDSTAE